MALALAAIYGAIVYISPVAKAVDAPLATPSGKVILTIDGNIGVVNAGTAADFDRKMLESLPQRELVVTTPWTDGKVAFSGPLLIDVLETVGAQDAVTLTATALNDYSVEIPADHVRKYEVILAMTMNGKTLRIRDRGPLWIIYPWTDENPELRDAVNLSRSVWQLRKISVK